MRVLAVVFLILVISNISDSQTNDSLTQLKTAQLRFQDSIIISFSPQARDNFIDLTAETDNWNIHLFRVINYNRSKFKDAVMPGFSKSVFPLVLLTPISAFTYGRVSGKTYDENTGYLLAASEVTNFVFTYTAKFLFKEPRPYSILRGVNKYTNLPLDPYSFPSAHTSFAFTTATAFALRYPKYPLVYMPMYMWGLLVAYSRPYLGVHYPVDVLAGMLIGTASGVLTYSLRAPLLKFKNNLLGESKQDDGSINGGVVSIFAASFIASELLTAFVLPDSPLLVSITPSPGDRKGINVAFSYGF